MVIGAHQICRFHDFILYLFAWMEPLRNFSSFHHTIWHWRCASKVQDDLDADVAQLPWRLAWGWCAHHHRRAGLPGRCPVRQHKVVCATSTDTAHTRERTSRCNSGLVHLSSKGRPLSCHISWRINMKLSIVYSQESNHLKNKIKEKLKYYIYLNDLQHVALK